MANKRKPTPGLDMESVRKVVTEHILDLMEAHEDEIVAVIAESEKKEVRVNFGVDLNLSESVASVDTTIRFSQTVTDKRSSSPEDPNQKALFPTEEIKSRKPRRRGGKSAASGDDANESESQGEGAD